MQLPRLLTHRRFWIGFGAGSLATVLCIVALATIWLLRTKHQVEQRLDQQWEDLQARTRPLLEPPHLPTARPIKTSPDARRLVADLSDWHIETLNGKTVETDQLTGHPLFITFWATWCSPCVAELPAIQRLANSPEAKSLNLRILLVTDEDPQPVERFLAQNPDLRNLPVVLAHDGIPAEIWFSARPETAILDCDGEVILRQAGPADWSAPAFRRDLQTALARSCGT